MGSAFVVAATLSGCLLASSPSPCYWEQGEQVIASGDQRAVERYLRHGGDPNSLTGFDPCHFGDWDSILSAACFQKQFAIVRLLLKHGAHVNGAKDEQQFPLWWAARSGHLGIVKEL